MGIYCVACQKQIQARLTTGAEVYPHRPDLHRLHFWICDTCKNFVGCHKTKKQNKKPLGHIATPQLKRLRQQIHSRLDPIWQSGKCSRTKLYDLISRKLGKKYHTATLKSEDEAQRVLYCDSIKKFLIPAD